MYVMRNINEFTMQAMHLIKHLPSIVPKHGIGFYLREDLAHYLSRKTVWGRSNDIAKSLTNGRGSSVQSRGRGSKVAVAGPISRQGKMIWGSR